MGLMKDLAAIDSKIYHNQDSAYWKVSDVSVDFGSGVVSYRFGAYASRDAAYIDETVYHSSFDPAGLPDIGRSTWLYTSVRSCGLSQLNITSPLSRDTLISALYDHIKNTISYFSDATDVFEAEQPS